MAAFVLFAHLLVSAHTVSHVFPPSTAGTSRHCAVCAIGKNSPGIPTVATTVCQHLAAWVAESASPPEAPTQDVDRATLSRAPPFAAAPATIG